jgi:fructosamine-3-kinase
VDRQALAQALGSEVRYFTTVHGGDINDAAKVSLADGRTVFVKSHENPPPGMFAAEAAGLEWLDGPVRVPRVIAVADDWLALEWIEMHGRPDAAALGRGLARLHVRGAPSFGLDQPNYLATLPQDNTPEPDWPTFFVERRLRPLFRRGNLKLESGLDALLRQRDLFGPPEAPARLHGDLWWGNVGSCDGTPVLIDPAVYGGHREIDLAMLALFGGIPDELVDAYDEVFPLADGWRERIPLYQLYPLAAHACLFGGSYREQVATTLARYT